MILSIFISYTKIFIYSYFYLRIIENNILKIIENIILTKYKELSLDFLKNIKQFKEIAVYNII